MKLADLTKALNNMPQYGQHVLIYGPAKSGKTFITAQLANSSKFKHVVWFDFEKGASTLLNPELQLTDEAKQKIEIVSVWDDPENPYAIEVAMQMFHPQCPRTVCPTHGRFACPLCKKEKDVAWIELPPFDIHTLVVVDSLSALTDSAYNLALRTADKNNKFAVFGKQGEYLRAFLSLMQHSKCNVVCITHETVGEDEATGKDKVAPLCGTRNLSLTVGRYFDAVVHRSVELKQFKTGSSPTYKMNYVCGSRKGVALEDGKHALWDLF